LLVALATVPAPAQLPSTPDNAIEAWLPHYYGDPMTASRENLASTTKVRQRFLGPAGGTPIAGLTIGKGSLLYDPAHRTAFYELGCCNRSSSIVARVRPPPAPMQTVDLSRLRTSAGIALGNSIARVESIMGRANPFRVNGHFGLLQLSYASLLPGSSGCGYFENFVFERDRLIFIDLTQGC
jgi:hypothetical protein